MRSLIITDRASKFLTTMGAIGEARLAVEDLAVGLFGYQRDEIVAAGLSLQEAEERLTAVANLRNTDAA